jgi:hypothetical protein
MAKKKETAKSTPVNPNADKIADAKPSAGWKQCKSCHKWVKGLKTKTCYACGDPFIFKGKGAKPTPATTTDAVKSVGKTFDTMKKVKHFIGKCQGYDNAKDIVSEFESLIQDCGSIGDLKKMIVGLEEWDTTPP